jgi:hypothetical protein
MDSNDDLEVHPEDSAAGAPIADDPPRRRHRRMGVILTGTVIGFLLGAAVVLLIDRSRATGDSGNPAVWLFGLPVLLAIAGTVIGWVMAGLPSAPVMDAPVRQRRFARRGISATSVRGQTPGSDVPPRYHDQP